MNTIYLDIVILINSIFDFSLLLLTDLMLKRNSNLSRIIYTSIIGNLSLLTIFINFNNIGLIFFKLILTFIMSIFCYGYRDIKYTFYNSIYLYLNGIILGGFMYYLLNEFKINMEYSYKYLIILILCPMTLIIYYVLIKRFKTNYNNTYKLYIEYGTSKFEGVGFLDSGNKLISPISGKPIILVEKEYIKDCKLKLLPVVYNALNYHGIVYCFKPDLVMVEDKEVRDVLIGISEVKFNIDGCNALLNARLDIG